MPADRRGAGRRRGGRGGAHAVVLGVISNPRRPDVRGWIRAHTMPSPALLHVFVIGKRGLSDGDRATLKKEARDHGDIERIDASDFDQAGGIFSCVDKLFAWFRHAPIAYPRARWYGKADDDSFVAVPQLVSMLSPLDHSRRSYVGYVQYDSFIVDQWKHCGWAATPTGAAWARQHHCPRNERVYGPFPFVVGALTFMSSGLARWFERSGHVTDLVRAGRASQASSKHWDCGYSDVTLGYALATANLTARRDLSRDVRSPRWAPRFARDFADASARRRRMISATSRLIPRQGVDLMSVRDAMADATYGAMNASRFVVSHHLRSREAFASAKAKADAAGAWEWSAGPRRFCTQWAEQLPDGRAHGDVVESGGRGGAAAETALRSYDCCDTWRVCDVRPAPQSAGRRRALRGRHELL